MIAGLFVLAQLTAAPTAAPAAAGTAPAAEKKVCRRFAETGSFVRKTKICRTQAEWRQVEENARETGREMQARIATERGG